ncbi:MAG: PEP-CTERM sorting domain-containing protein [Alphaproteobacteria bacterium]|nr:PEP-CTERM sorting domain-containing protein [Alphaproteobacteria bacterium]
MIIKFKHLLLVPLFGLILSSNALAVVLIGDTILTGTNGLINVTERQSEIGLEYALDIITEPSEISVYSFAVSTNTAAESSFTVGTYRRGWAGEQLTPNAWNTMFGSSVGLFSSFFAGDLYANYFKMMDGSSITGASDEFFQFYHGRGFAASQFVALNANNGVISQSLRTANVPEPAPLALLGLGLMGLGLMKKRRK